MNNAGEGPGLTGHRVFISYCSQESVSAASDKITAERICSALESHKIPCWMAPRDILPGEDWLNSIFDAVEVSKVIVVVFSANTQASEWVKDEVKFALDKKIKVIPFRIENVEPRGTLRILKVRCQWLDAFKPPLEKHIERLVKVVRNHLEKEGEVPPLKEPGFPTMVGKEKIEVKPGKTPGRMEKTREVDTPGIPKPPERAGFDGVQRNGITGKKIYKTVRPLLLKRGLIAASIIISITAAIFIISQLANNRKYKPADKPTDKIKNGEVEVKEVSIEKPGFIVDLEKRGDVEVTKRSNDSWESVYKDYGIAMIYIPAGEFTMGSEDGANDEKPVHKVYLDGYWISKYEVTFSQYDKYCEMTGKEKPNDRGWGRENRPVINVSWEDAAAYCQWLSGKTGLKFNLPTEAQWEKAARGTDGREYPWGSHPWDSREPGRELVNFNGIIGKTTPVGSYLGGASPYGILDMAGNVSEWCDSDYYKNSPKINPPGPANGSSRVLRGGDWSGYYSHCRAASRYDYLPALRGDNVGFRLVRSL